jgi:hypothetical protein
MAPKKDCLTDKGKALIHEFRNCVHQIHMELDLAELGLERFEYGDLVTAVDYMTCSLEDLRVRLIRIRGEGRSDDKNL